MPCMNSGDLATWTGSGVAFLALIAASTAAYYSYQASKKQHRNDILISANDLIEKRSDKINKIFGEMFGLYEAYREKTTLRDGSYRSGADSYILHAETNRALFERIRMVESLVTQTCQTLREFEFVEEDKKKLISSFFSLWDFNIIEEIILNTNARIFFSHKMFYSKEDEQFGFYRKKISEEIKKTGLFTDMYTRNSTNSV